MTTETLRDHQRIVVTGMGAITPLGLNAETSWLAITRGIKSGIQRLPMSLIDKFELPQAYLGGLVSSEFNLTNDPAFAPYHKELRRTHRSHLFALAASAEALRQAGLFIEETLVLDTEQVNPKRIGVRIGTGIGGAGKIGNTRMEIEARKRRFGPSGILAVLPERVATVPSMHFKARGPVGTFISACASGNDNLILGSHLLQLGEADVVIAGGVEATLEPEAFALFGGVEALSKSKKRYWASRPFDTEADGIVMSEAAGILVLETLEHARRRGAIPLAEMLSYAQTADADDPTTPTGDGAYEAMTLARQRAVNRGLDIATSLAYINAHATSTPVGDGTEIKAIAQEFEPDQVVGVSSTKSATGHMLGSTGAVESIFCVKTLETRIIPPSLKLDNPIPETDGWPMIPHKAKRVKKLDYAVNNSFGFGGLNSVIIYRRLED